MSFWYGRDVGEGFGKFWEEVDGWVLENCYRYLRRGGEQLPIVVLAALLIC